MCAATTSLSYGWLGRWPSSDLISFLLRIASQRTNKPWLRQVLQIMGRLHFSHGLQAFPQQAVGKIDEMAWDNGLAPRVLLRNDLEEFLVLVVATLFCYSSGL